MKIKYILVQLNSKCQYTFCNYSNVPVCHSEPYWQTSSHDYSDKSEQSQSLTSWSGLCP